MKKALGCLFLLGMACGAAAQKPSVTSPYLYDEWSTGTITTATGGILDAVKLRFDSSNDEVEYQAEVGVTKLGNAVNEFSLLTGSDLYLFKKGYPSVGQLTENSFYRVLYDGNLKVLKRYNNGVNSSGKKAEGRSEQLYILKNNKMIPVKTNDRKGVMQLVADKKNHMEYAAKEQQLDFGREEDIVKLIEEYDAYVAGGKE
jgi:hypothetical protein